MYNALETLKVYQDLLRELEKAPAPLSVSGGMESQKHQLAAALAEHAAGHAANQPGVGAGWALYVCADEKEAAGAAADLSCFMKGVWQYPARDLLFYHSDIHGSYILNRRMEALRHLLEDPRGILVTTVDALMDQIQPRESLQNDLLKLAEGMIITTRSLSRILTGLGYEHAAAVEGMGQYSIRGGIVDIYPMTAEEPCRIEFFDDEIDTIRSFDPATQRSVERLKEVEIFPAGDSISKGQKVSLLEYFDEKALIFADDPVRLKARAEMVETEFAESMERRREKGIIPDGGAGVRPYDKSGQGSREDGEEGELPEIFSAARVFESLRSRRTLLLAGLDESLAGFGAKLDFHFNTAAVGNYRDSFEMLISDIRNYQKQGYRITVLTPSKTRTSHLAAMLREYDIRAYVPDEGTEEELKSGETEVVCGSLKQGFVYPDIKYVLMTESDMFGQTARKRRARKKYDGQKLISLTELKDGDYVVHETHGIGIYRGIQHIVREHVGKDYIRIEYADGGNLYLPATRLDLIQKYADSEAVKPKLNRLNGTEWQKTRTRVKKAVNDIAKELIELYASRLNASGYRYSPDTVWQKEFEELFPYEETEDQLSAIQAVKEDMESGRIMDRLICGDVGYGKTEIALRAAFKAVQDSKQVAFLVPTTILAQQHYNTFVERLSKFPVKIGMMSRFRTPQQNKKLAEQVAAGKVDIVIGTHRLLSKDVQFKNPGLLIIDEEQRFGVAHKERIKQLKKDLDVLTLTATPIPRTLHMSLAGIRDLSILEEPPFDRVPIQTYVMEYNDEFVREAISRELARGGQVFYVYNRVREIEDKTSHLRALLPDARIEYAHGQMHERELEDLMMEFVNGEIDVLVSTTIVETGLDIPNANTLIVDGAERMGLSQLYQLRGRVGRSSRTAYAFLMYRRNKVLTEEAEKRLKAIREFTEFGAGIKIAMRDLEIRGAGNVLGAEQHGQMQAVGYDLYCKLLNQAVRLLQGEIEEKPEFETTVECDIDAYIPPDYIPDEYQKLDMYKRISEISDDNEYSDMQDELTDRYGDIPREVQALLDIVRLKTRAHEAYVTDLVIRSGSIRMEMFPRAQINVEAIPGLIEKERGRLKLIRGQHPRFVYDDEKAGYRGPEYMMNKALEIVEALRQEK